MGDDLDPIRHEVSVQKLQQILLDLPLDWLVVPNTIRNLSLLDERRRVVGHIDLVWHHPEAVTYGDMIEVTDGP